MRRYVAAAALQRMWRTRIELALRRRPLIPPAYLRELGLPPLEEDYGRAALRALSADEEARYGYDAWAGYTSLMDLFLSEIELRGWGAPPPLSPSRVEGDTEGTPSSLHRASPAQRARAG